MFGNSLPVFPTGYSSGNDSGLHVACSSGNYQAVIALLNPRSVNSILFNLFLSNFLLNCLMIFQFIILNSILF